ncbi:hypothetical protein OP10G_2491 [Fimbriimonas ginsengisoli Gsoil 348]|uniref:Uncharacterized protein n=1 Tax=Fimbriimonas ginsengisoli Gsoil 348 TaxID=661478 RepID=A0A068NW75_FIMGI|nr:hypothetical protein OP10G_2491 [Fimbriimonas ginsengisoli Gsoil 348]
MPILNVFTAQSVPLRTLVPATGEFGTNEAGTSIWNTLLSTRRGVWIEDESR